VGDRVAGEVAVADYDARVVNVVGIAVAAA
jgi:hypothetical protein